MVWNKRRYPFGSIGREIDEMMSEMESRFQDMFSGSQTLLPEAGGVSDRLMPAIKGEFRVDVCDHNDELVIVADIPGVQKEDVRIRLFDPRTLEISSERSSEKKEEEENYFMRERIFGSMCRRVRLPVDVVLEGAKATFTNGVLEIRLLKSPKEAGQSIPIE
ncbi:MAG: Hsp20/alpha crystallin family protein [Methanocalculus sp.]|uniref:Hsp20/alpha crystallin family protein n=1 Tax=Methanocalculus sp. TaxID=2004547 RepID=UPI00271FEEE8|nr:Hsp20/alpha crystallin family protein [Methanocalculus sp.]MDO8841735.1 Hsp20/alpha crystallin family protein [Methanocalculus sp.]MDO9538397.1 Hsp20/alpha crystallin family protein [Methanocalculus sp.]